MNYRVLNYANGRIVSDLSVAEVLGILRYLMAGEKVSFDIVTHNNQFVTSDFESDANGKWLHNPKPQVRAG